MKQNKKGPQTTANSLQIFYVKEVTSSQQKHGKPSKRRYSPCSHIVQQACRRLRNLLPWTNRK